MKHRINVNVYNWFGGLVRTVSIDTFGTEAEAKETAQSYRDALRMDYGLGHWVKAKVQTFQWEGA